MIAIHNFLQRACKLFNRCDPCKIKQPLNLGSYLSINLGTVYSSQKKSLRQTCPVCCMQCEVRGLKMSAGCDGCQGWPVERDSRGEPFSCEVMLLCLEAFKLGHAGKACRVYYYYLSPAQNLALVLLISVYRGIFYQHRKDFVLQRFYRTWQGSNGLVSLSKM